VCLLSRRKRHFPRGSNDQTEAPAKPAASSGDAPGVLAANRSCAESLSPIHRRARELRSNYPELVDIGPDVVASVLAQGLIDVHHTRPVQRLVEGDITKLDELSLLCANCHRDVQPQEGFNLVDLLRLV
jgi:hypothetical protein